VFLPHHSIAPAMLPLDLCFLGLFWACHVLFPYLIHITQCLYRVNPHTILGFFSPFHSFGHPRSILFLWTSLTHSILTFPWTFAMFFGLPGPITISFTFRVHWPLYQPHLLIPFFLDSFDPFFLAFYFL